MVVSCINWYSQFKEIVFLFFQRTTHNKTKSLEIKTSTDNTHKNETVFSFIISAILQESRYLFWVCIVPCFWKWLVVFLTSKNHGQSLKVASIIFTIFAPKLKPKDIAYLQIYLFFSF